MPAIRVASVSSFGDRLRAAVAPAALDGLLLLVFMVVAAGGGVLLEDAGSPLHTALPTPLARRAVAGILMGVTATLLIGSPIGRRSGAHFNPATTLTFVRLGRVAPVTALAYVPAQFVGGTVGLLLAWALLGDRLAAPGVHFVATQPGAAGAGVAFATEVAMTFVQLGVVLRLSQSPRWTRWTGVAAGALVAAFITFLEPLSGMSLNPARSFASALLAGDWRGFWVYGCGPLLGMLSAAQWFLHRRGADAVRCAKLRHDGALPCPFRCRFVGAGNVAAPRASIAATDTASPWTTTTSS